MTRRELLLAASGFALTGSTALAAVCKDSKDAQALSSIAAKAKSRGWDQLPLGALSGRIGLELAGTPYMASTLEVDGPEACVLNLQGLDCVTFYESCLGLARCIRRGRASIAGLRHEITRMRYRDGRIDGYGSRLHYTTDWFHDNEKRGLVKLIAKDLPGSVPFSKKIDFMSTHPASYRQLKWDSAMVARIAEVERQMASRALYYVPVDKVAEAEPHLQTGDIVGIATSVAGLDCSHTGLCYRDGDTLRFLHASSKAMKVILDRRLSDYLKTGPKNTGVMIARPA
jgi:hypothetical protein